jgi:sortase A
MGRVKFRLWWIPASCVVLGLSIAAGAVWSKFGNLDDVRDHQSQLEQQLQVSAGDGFGNIGASALVKPPKPLPGEALARIKIPSLKQEWVVVEGTAPGDIAEAPGHYEFSALPGQKGNFAVAGHREPGLFWDLDRVKTGDLIVVESRRGTFTYVVTRNFITSPQSWPEVSATPPGFGKGTKILTLTTCNPRWDNYERLVIHAVIQG